MVLYFTSTVVAPPYSIYVGADKHENEELLKWAFPEDVWFHVDKLSSAHVYLRLRQTETIDDIPSDVVTDCVQLVKANSIQGNKTNNIEVVYTMASNLKKTGDMDVGQVGFHRAKDVRTVKVEKRINEIVNRLNKTKLERQPDLRAEREARDRAEREKVKAADRETKRRQEDDAKKQRDETERRSYSSLMKTDKMSTNYDSGNDSDDFM